jgi:hypothetical protein
MELLDLLSEVINLLFEGRVLFFLVRDDLFLSTFDFFGSLGIFDVISAQSFELLLGLFGISKGFDQRVCDTLLTRKSILKKLLLLIAVSLLFSKELSLRSSHNLDLSLQVVVDLLNALQLGNDLFVLKSDRSHGRLAHDCGLGPVLELLEELALLVLEKVGAIAKLRELGVALEE